MRSLPIDCHEVFELTEGWQAAASAPGVCANADHLDALDWIPATVPGTAAGALAAAGRWRPHDSRSFDAEDWWFRVRFAAGAVAPGEEVALFLDGIATVAEVYLNGELILAAGSMFLAHELDVTDRLRERNELAICCRALAPLLAQPHSPRARWRTRLVTDGALRFYRTMLLGRAPGFAPGPAAVGPWRGVRLERRRGFALEALTLRARLIGETGLLAVNAQLRLFEPRSEPTAHVELRGPSGGIRAVLSAKRQGAIVAFEGELIVPEVGRWWPHTHGDPVLHEATLWVEGIGEPVRIAAGRVGFRTIAAGPVPGHDAATDGLDLHVNGVSVFARGALWTPADPVTLAPDYDELRATLERAREAGMNMLRIPGTACYESDAFHDICDELGILVWQDFMFANLDYPIADPAFYADVIAEARAVLAQLGSRPSLAVVCGNSEIEQQVAMLGLDSALGRGDLFGELLPALLDEAAVDAIYLPSAPCGGELPFRSDRGVANYFGVGGYRRPLSDVRRAEVRFASECLAFANVPGEEALREIFDGAAASVDDARWKLGVPRDAGAGWDFDDVRDHYLALLYHVDPVELRHVDPARYLDLSRAVTGEVMADVFGEWRRASSGCGGGLVLWLRDIAPGAGWGLLDHRGRPKAAYHHLRRALAPVCVWMTDEGLGGVDIHLANDGPAPLAGKLRVSLYHDFTQLVGESVTALELAPHSTLRHGVEALLGRFCDAAWAYRFGPPAQDLIVASLEDPAGALRSQALLFPAGRPLAAESAERLGVEATLATSPAGGLQLQVRSERLVYGVALDLPGYVAAEEWFSVEPGRQRIVELRQLARAGQPFVGGELTALNLQGRLPLELASLPV